LRNDIKNIRIPEIGLIQFLAGKSGSRRTKSDCSPGLPGRNIVDMKLLRYVWALPNTLLGFLFIPPALLTKGQMKIVDGVLEIHGGFVTWFLKHGLPVSGYLAALTLGHVVLGYNKRCLSVYRRHEHAHVRQYEILGPVFLPVYLAATIWAWIRGRGAYKGNYLERKAREHSHEN